MNLSFEMKQQIVSPGHDDELLKQNPQHAKAFMEEKEHEKLSWKDNGLVLAVA